MDWASFASVVGAVVVGGVITIWGQTLSSRQQERSKVYEERRAAKTSALERHRDAVRQLHDAVCEDLAYIRQTYGAADDLLNQDRAIVLGPIAVSVRERHDRRASVIAVVNDELVRAAADAVYETWGEWITYEEDRMINEAPNDMAADTVRRVDTSLASAVRAYLEKLNNDAEALYS